MDPENVRKNTTKMTAIMDPSTAANQANSVSSMEKKRKNADTPTDKDSPAQVGGLRSYLRIFSYTDSVGWILNILAFVSAIGAGSALPLMDVLFGKMVTKFNSFSTGTTAQAEFRSEMNKFT
jgi:ATP-binding cassette subfamily B (MDR/TAP) protein 1